MRVPARLTAQSLAARPLRAAATAVLVILGACGGGSEAGRVVTEPPAPKLVELWLEVNDHTPERTTADSVERGDMRILRAQGRLSNGQIIHVDSAAWTVSDSATLRPFYPTPAWSMAVRATGEGNAWVAAAAGGLRAEVRYAVLRPKARFLLIHPTGSAMPVSPDSVVVRSARRYAVDVASQFGPLTDRVATWQSSDTAVASVAADGTVSARAVGTTKLTAAVEGLVTSVTVVVRPPLAARLAITYAPDSLFTRRRDSVRAVLYDSAGAPMAVQPRLSATGSATLLEGVVRGDYVGATEVVASGDGLTVRRPLRVLATPQGPPATYPATVNATAGTSLLLAARAVDIDGFAFNGVTPPGYTSADPAVASVSGAGVVTARAPGTTIVQVTTGGTHTDVPVTVLAASNFAMTFRSARVTPLPATLDAALRTAAGAWEHVIIGDLPDLQFTLPPGACDVPAVVGDVTIDDLLIFASADSIDGPGGVLAQAGPCIIRGDGSAAAGRVQVDSADLARLAAQGQLATVLEHELGHVLGIGTLWSRPSLGFVIRSSITSYRYVGPRGLRVSDWWALGPLGGAPLGEANGPGDGHWDEATFRSELMTPVLNTGANPLSLLTIEALADLGYATAAAGAEAYALYLGAPATLAARLSPSRAVAPAVGAAGAAFDRLLVPRWRVSGSGRVQVLPIGGGR